MLDPAAESLSPGMEFRVDEALVALAKTPPVLLPAKRARTNKTPSGHLLVAMEETDRTLLVTVSLGRTVRTRHQAAKARKLTMRI